MRAWNLLVKEKNLVLDIVNGRRNYLCYQIGSISAKRVHVGDSVIVHNCVGIHHQVQRTVVKKEMIRKQREGIDKEKIPCICIYFSNSEVH